MRDSDWSRKILLRSDWSGPHVASMTTLVALAEALAYRKDLNIEQLETNVFKSFEFKELLLNFSASIIHIVFTCRQPISAKNGLTYALFFDDFSTLLEPLVSASGKLLLAGDLNFHINNPSESNAYKFLDVLSCFNLNTLNVSIPIHKSIWKSNNLLHLIITRSGESTAFNLSGQWPQLSRNTLLSTVF